MATKPKASDKQVQDLIEVVKKKKAEIATAERPNYKTNMSFRYNPDSSANINLNTVSDLSVLAPIAGFLLTQQTYIAAGNSFLSLEKVEPKWQGYLITEWLDDIQKRAAKIQINKKKAELEILEARLNTLISPELKRQMELDEIMEKLK